MPGLHHSAHQCSAIPGQDSAKMMPNQPGSFRCSNFSGSLSRCGWDRSKTMNARSESRLGFQFLIRAAVQRKVARCSAGSRQSEDCFIPPRVRLESAMSHWQFLGDARCVPRRSTRLVRRYGVCIPGYWQCHPTKDRGVRSTKSETRREGAGCKSPFS